MTTPEARRHDLYNALSDFIGADQADTLMAYLPSQATAELATRADIQELGTRIERLEDRLDSVNQRLDRLFLTLAAGLIAMIAAVFAQAIL